MATPARPSDTRTGRGRDAIRGLAATLLLAALALPLAGCQMPQAEAVTGRHAPDYAAVDLEGRKVNLADLRGQVVVLNIWATWCYPCRKEMPALEEMHRELERNGLVVLAVSVDAASASGEIRDFLTELGLTLPVLHDSRATVSRTFSTRGVPETFLIGADGVLRHHWIGRIDPRSESVRGPVMAALRDMHS
jgi:cytochrome c biogenesis protein CcmG, thiol:disulfide interchange protein DsbE